MAVTCNIQENLPVALLERTLETIREYDLVSAAERVVVALSGGKDSLVMALVLRALGFDPIPVVVDMGYEAGWGDRVLRHARMLGLEPLLISARDEFVEDARRDTVTLQIRRKVEILDQIGTLPGEHYTPCTYCYSVKVLALSRACRNHSASRVAFGHHATDSAVSLTKEALMYVDRWDRGHERFTRSGFESLIHELAREANEYGVTGRPCPLTTRIGQLVRTREVDTDEPPKQHLLRHESAIAIVRPFFAVRESEIYTVAAALGLPVEPSGCGHGATHATQTPRQMIHHRVFGQASSEAFHVYMSHLVAESVTSTGWGRVNSRRSRAERLGPAYKPAIDGFDKL